VGNSVNTLLLLFAFVVAIAICFCCCCCCYCYGRKWKLQTLPKKPMPVSVCAVIKDAEIALKVPPEPLAQHTL